METNSDIELIDHLTKRPEMFVGSSSFDCVTSFLCGYDSAKNSNFLIGFQEWLTMRIGFGHNLVWYALVEQEVLGHIQTNPVNRSKEENQQLLEGLRLILTEYFRHRSKIGIRNVLYDHGCWIRKHDWFDENVERYGSSSGPAEQINSADAKKPRR